MEVAELFGHHLLLALSFLERDERELVVLGKAFGAATKLLVMGFMRAEEAMGCPRWP
jgi:hypothetical protein